VPGSPIDCAADDTEPASADLGERSRGHRPGRNRPGRHLRGRGNLSTERTGTTTLTPFSWSSVNALDDLRELGATDLRALLGEHPPALGRDRQRRDPPDEIVVGVAARLEAAISMYSSAPQSSSRMITSWATSTRRRVRYPESAVRRAVSASPFARRAWR